MTSHAMAAVAVFATGCTGPVRVVHPQSCPATLRVERPSPELLIPRAEGTFIPPMPVPTTIHGSRMLIRVVVDTDGRVMQDSVMVCGIKDPMYAQRLSEEAAQLRFRPGLMRAKHVVAPTLLTYGF